MDLGNLKILLDMATTGNLKSTLDNVDRRLDNMREKASNLHLGFDDKSISALSTKINDIVGALSDINRNAGTKLADGMRESVSSSDQLLKVTKELEAAEARLASSKERSAHLDEERIRRNEKLADVQRSILKSQEEAELYNLRHKTGIESKDIDTLTKYLDLIKELKKLTPWNKGTGSETWAATTDETVAIVDRLAKKWNIAREEVEKYFRTFQSYSGHRYNFSFDDKMGLYNLSLSQRTNEFSPGSDEKLKAYKDSARAAKDAIKELADEEEHLHHALDETRQKLTSANAEVKEESAEVKRLSEAKKELSKTEGQSSVGAQKEITSEMKAQVTLSSELEAYFKEMLGAIRSIAEGQGKVAASTKASAAAAKEATQEQEKLYDITRLRELAEEKSGKLKADQVSVLKQMEGIMKALVAIDEKYKTNLAQELEQRIRYGGLTKEQIGTYQAVITRMQAAMQVEEKASRQQEKTARQQKQSAKERESAAKKQAQLETTLIRIDTQLLGVDQQRLQEQTKLLLAKKQDGTITQEEATKLSALLSQEKAIVNAERQKGEATKQTNAHLTRQSTLLSQIKSYLATYVSVIGAANLIRSLVRITGEFEAQHVALRAILQDVAGADRIFYQLQELAVKSPFTFRNLTDYAKQLSAFSVPMNEIYDTTKRLADVSAGLGVDMSRIILAYGQIRSASFLRGQEVRQLTEAGIPVLQELSRQFKEIEGEAVSVGKVFDKISARQVPFEMIEKMFRDLTSEGGKFYQMQEVLAETVKGKVSNLQDAWEIMLSKIGEDNSGFIKGVLDGVTKLIKNYQDLAKAITLAAVAYGTYRTAAMAAGQAQVMQALILADTGKKVTQIRALMTVFGQGLSKIPAKIAGIVSKLNPWAVGIAAVTTATVALIMHVREMNRHIRETDKLTNDAIAKAEASKSNIHYYVQELKKAKEGTEEYNRARQAIINNSGSYISATDAERLSLQNVDDVWVNICKHIEEATKLQAMQSLTANASAAKQESQLKVIDELTSYQQKHNLSKEEFNFIAAYIRGEKTYQDLYYNPVSQKGYLFQRAVAWRRDYEKAQQVYDETIKRGEQNLSALYGSGKESPAGEPEPLTGWRLRAQNYLDKFNGKTRGVKISEETNLADLAESGAKSLNELRDALNRIPSTESDYKAVERDIKFWEQLSEAIYGKGNTEFNSSTKLTKQQIKDANEVRKEQIQAIKQSVQDLKEAKRWYDQLTPLLGSENAKTLLASFNFAVPKEGFGAAFQGFADQLKSLGDENGARDVLNWANGREVGDVLDSAKAIEKYTEALRDLEAQTKRLNLSGFAQDLDKIIVDADSKNRQLETDWAQKAEELEKAKGGWIQRYRIENEKATEEEALRAWEDFYKQQTDIAKAAMDTQREYNRKVAQEQINDRASKWLEEMMKENNIDLHDMSDKSIGQMDVIISRLRALVTSNALANLIPAELLSDAEKLNITFDELLDNIQRIVDTKAGDVQVERMKKILSGVSSGLSALGLSANTGGIQDSYAKYVEKLREEDDAQKALNKAKEEYYANADKYLDDDEKFIKSLEKLRDAQQKLKEATNATDEAYSELHMSVMLAGVQAISSGMDQLGKSIAKIGGAKGDESLKSLGESMSNISNALSDAASTAAIGLQIGGVLGAVVGAGLSVIKSILSSILDGIAKAEQYNREVRIATDEWALSVTRLRNEYALLQEQLDTIFGSEGMSKMAGWLDILREQRDILNGFNTGGPYAMDGNYILNAANLGNYGLVTKDYGWFENAFVRPDEVTSLKYVVPELFNEAGGLNFEYLDEFMQSDWFEKLSDEWKAVLNNMAEANKQFEAACKEMTDYLSSIFGEAGASIADAMISSFEATGQVALETGDILSSVARRFVSDWTQAFLTKNYLSDLSNAITDVWMDGSLNMEEQVSQSLGLMRDAMMAMSDRLPEIQQFYEGLEDQFHWAEGAGEEIGDAIKTAMVEQNSSLIAGYINSMRADLSMQRNEIMRNISPAVMTISNGITEHFRTVASIDGNVSRIWSRLDLLTSPGSGVKMNTRM